MRVGSIFSGIGGLDLAASRAFGGKPVFMVEQDPHCVKVLARHWPGVAIINEDVQKVNPADLPACDVLTGGWPCVNLSVAGDRTGLEGEKSRLYTGVCGSRRLSNLSGLSSRTCRGF